MKQSVNVRLQIDFQPVFKDLNTLDDKLQIVAVKGFFVEDVLKHIQGSLCCSVDLDDGVALVGEHGDLVIQPFDFLLQFGFQFVVGFRQQFLLLRVLHDVPDALPLGGFQFLTQFSHHLRQMVGGLLRFQNILGFPCQIGVELRQHGAGVFFYLFHIELEKLVQLIHPNVVGGTGRTPPAVIGAAGVGGAQIFPAHGEHGAAAVAAEEKAGVNIIVFFHAPVVGSRAFFPERPGDGEGAVIDDGLVVVLNDDVFLLVPAYILAVDFCPGVLCLPQGSDIEIVVQNPLYRDNGPSGFGLPGSGFAPGFPAHLL